MSLLLVNGNALNIPLADNSVQCVVTSPPYWNLRDYQTADQIGLETTAEEFIEKLVLVFREVRRVLREDGQLFLNISDTRTDNREWAGIPHRLVFALQADGWRYEDEVVWNKPNPMPGSQVNRFTRSHEFVFMLNKSRDAFFDADAVREEASTKENRPYGIVRDREWGYDSKQRKMGRYPKQDELGKRTYTGFNDRWDENPVNGRNKRTVWDIATQPFSLSLKIDRYRRVGLDAVSDGMKYIVSPSCPVHAGLFDRAARGFYGGRGAASLSRIIDTYRRLSQLRLSGFVPIRPLHGDCYEVGNSGFYPRVYSPSAIDHSNEAHRMALDLGSTAPYIPYAEKAFRTLRHLPARAGRTLHQGWLV
jgi:hypothetical protein